MELRQIASRAPEMARRSTRWLSARRERKRASAGQEVRSSITVGKSPDEVYRLWLDPNTISRVVDDVAKVELIEEDRLRWRLKAPLGDVLEWETSVKAKQPGRHVAWTSPSLSLLGDVEVELRSAPGDRGTEVQLTVHSPAASLAGAAAGLLEGAPKLMARAGEGLSRGALKVLAAKALHRFKSLAETGEIPSLAHNPAGEPRTLEK